MRPLEIAINRNRGLYLSIFENGQEPKPFDNLTTEGKLVAEEQAISDLKYYLKLLIAEKYIIYLAKHEKGIDSLIEIIRKWDDSIDTADLDLDILEKYFLNLSDYFFKRFDEISYRTERNFRRFLKIIFLHLTSALRARRGVIVQFSVDFFVSIPINVIYNLDIWVFGCLISRSFVIKYNCSIGFFLMMV